MADDIPIGLTVADKIFFTVTIEAELERNGKKCYYKGQGKSVCKPHPALSYQDEFNRALSIATFGAMQEIGKLMLLEIANSDSVPVEVREVAARLAANPPRLGP